MLDVDHLKEPPETVYAQKIAGKIDLLGIVGSSQDNQLSGFACGRFPQSQLENACRKSTLAGGNLMLEKREACKDWAKKFIYRAVRLFSVPEGLKYSIQVHGQFRAEKRFTSLKTPKMDYDAAAQEIVENNNQLIQRQV